MLARRVSAEGRTRAYLNGRVARRSGDLRDARRRACSSFYGQHEHRKLTLASAQLDMLDGFCGAEQAAAARRVRGGLRDGRASCAPRSRSCAARGGRARPRARPARVRARRDRGGSTRARPRRRELLAERERLRHLEGAARRGAGRRRGAGARGAAGAARRALLGEAGRAARRASAGVDPQLDALAERCARAAIEADDLAAELRRYARGRRGRARARSRRSRSAWRRSTGSKRKHGGTSRRCSSTPSAAARGATSWRAPRWRSSAATAELAAARGRADAAARRAARRPRGGRARLAERGARAARRAGDGGRDVRGRARRRATSPGRPGAERSSSCIAPNPGVPAGAAARDRLGRRAVAGDARAHGRRPRRRRGAAPTLVFDEVDAGIGGQTARAVGEQLRALADGPAGPLHHPPAADRLARRAPLPDREGTGAEPARTTVERARRRRRRRRARAHARRRRRRRGAAGTQRSCSRRREAPQRVAARPAPRAPWPCQTTAAAPRPSTTARTAAAQFRGIARLREAHEAPRQAAAPGDIAIIDHRDLDRVSAEDLVACGRRGGRQLPRRRRSGRYPNMGPLCSSRPASTSSTSRARRSSTRSRTATTIVVRGRRDPAAAASVVATRRGAGPRGGRTRPPSSAGARSARRSRRSPRTRRSTCARSASCWPAGSSCRSFDTDFRDRPALVVVRGVDHQQRPAQALRPYIRDVQPVLVGVDGGADAILEEGFKPDMIVGDMDSADRARRCAAAPSSSSTPIPTAARPGRERLERLGLALQGRPGARRPARTSRC